MGQSQTIVSQTELVSAIKRNDSKALKALYTSNYYKIEQLVLKNSGTKEHAKDIYQEAFISVWKTIKNDSFVPKNDTALQGYLFQIAKNKWMDVLRSKTFKKTIQTSKMAHFELSDNDFDENDDDVLKEKRLDSIMEVFKRMRSPCKELLKTFYFEQKSLRDIANDLQIEENTARNKKYRCMEKLRELVLNSK